MPKKVPYNYSDNLLFILTMLECIEKLNLYVEDFDNANDFFEANNQLEYNASCHLLLAIGEESKKIDLKLKDEISFIEWTEIGGLRNRIAHDYRGLDYEMVFLIIQNELGILKQALIQFIKIIKPEPADLKLLVNSKYFKHLNYLC
jgi:uncharacterized protein with HEPN domain